jgi:hypothetical protein
VEISNLGALNMRSFWMTLASSLAADPFASYAGAPALVSMSYPAAAKGRRLDAEGRWAAQDRAARFGGYYGAAATGTCARRA